MVRGSIGRIETTGRPYDKTPSTFEEDIVFLQSLEGILVGVFWTMDLAV